MVKDSYIDRIGKQKIAGLVADLRWQRKINWLYLNDDRARHASIGIQPDRIPAIEPFNH